jgi:stage V sporulation protein S
MELLKVSSASSPGAVAGAIANSIREYGQAEVQAIGPRAVNQAVKAMAIARGYLATSGVDLYFIPGFSSVSIDDEERTAILFSMRTRHPVTRSEDVSA